MISSPAENPVTPGPGSATIPARSLPWPDGNTAGHRECSSPSRILASPGLIPAALTWTRTWPGPGTGRGTSTTCRTPTPPYSSNRTAFGIATPSLRLPRRRRNRRAPPVMPAGLGRRAGTGRPAPPAGRAGLGRGGRDQRQPGGGLDLGQPEVGHQPLPAPGGQAGQHLLQVGDVARHDGEQVVGLAGDVVGRDDLRQRPDLVVEDAVRARVVPAEGGGHVCLQGESGGGRVELGADDPDDARLLQPADPVQRRRWGQADEARELDVRAVGILLQRREQLYINFVKINSHITICYLVSASNSQILYELPASMGT